MFRSLEGHLNIVGKDTDRVPGSYCEKWWIRNRNREDSNTFCGIQIHNLGFNTGSTVLRSRSIFVRLRLQLGPFSPYNYEKFNDFHVFKNFHVF
jgi:hypothetical protein